MRGERERRERERGISECVIWNPHERIGNMRIQFNTKGLFVYEEQFLKTVFFFFLKKTRETDNTLGTVCL